MQERKVNLAHFQVVGGWVMFSEEIGKVFEARSPVDQEMSLTDAVADPMETHVHGFGAMSLDGIVDDANCGGVVSLAGCGSLRVIHFNEGGTHGDAVPAVDEKASNFGFGGG